MLTASSIFRAGTAEGSGRFGRQPPGSAPQRRSEGGLIGRGLGKVREECEEQQEQQPFPSEQYFMYREDGGTQRGQSRHSGNSSRTESLLSAVSEAGRVIDGRYTINEDDEYVSVEVRNTHTY